MLFLEKLKRLEAAFRTQPLNKESSQLYFDMLEDAGVDDATFAAAVENIIEAEDFFPSVSKLRKYCGIEDIYDAAGRRLKYT